MSRTTLPSFKYVEYTGADAADVLVTLIMNLSHPDGPPDDKEVHEGESSVERHPSTERVIGFVPNPQEEEEEVGEDE